MDDILFAHAEKRVLLQTYAELQVSLQNYGLCIAPETVQRSAPFSYLGTLILQGTVKPQKVQIQFDPLKTLIFKNYPEILIGLDRS